MARPRTHGRPISFRLPLDYHDMLEKRAAEHGESVPEYVRRNILRALDKTAPKTNGRKPDRSHDEVTPIPKKKATTS